MEEGVMNAVETLLRKYQFALHSKHVIVPKYRFSSSLPVRVRADETRFPTQFLVFHLTVKLGSVTMAAARQKDLNTTG